METLNHRYATL